VRIVTAVRCVARNPETLWDTIESLGGAGIHDLNFFVDGRFSKITRLEQHGLVLHRRRAVGAWPNFFLPLAELVMREPNADYYLVMEDGNAGATPAVIVLVRMSQWASAGFAGRLRRGHGAQWGRSGSLVAAWGPLHRAATESADGFHPCGAVKTQSLKDRGHCRGDAASFALGGGPDRGQLRSVSSAETQQFREFFAPAHNDARSVRLSHPAKWRCTTSRRRLVLCDGTTPGSLREIAGRASWRDRLC
jgi:hypothetical protein